MTRVSASNANGDVDRQESGRVRIEEAARDRLDVKSMNGERDETWLTDFSCVICVQHSAEPPRMGAFRQCQLDGDLARRPRRRAAAGDAHLARVYGPRDVADPAACQYVLLCGADRLPLEAHARQCARTALLEQLQRTQVRSVNGPPCGCDEGSL